MVLFSFLSLKCHKPYELAVLIHFKKKVTKYYLHCHIQATSFNIWGLAWNTNWMTGTGMRYTRYLSGTILVGIAYPLFYARPTEESIANFQCMTTVGCSRYHRIWNNRPSQCLFERFSISLVYSAGKKPTIMATIFIFAPTTFNTT